MDTAPYPPPDKGACASSLSQAGDESTRQNKTAPQDTSNAISQQFQSQRSRASLEDLFKAFTYKQNNQLEAVGKALQTQIQTQTGRINGQVQALSGQIAEYGIRIDQVVARVDQLGTRIDRLEDRMETVENTPLCRRQAPYSRPSTFESKDSALFHDDYATK